MAIQRSGSIQVDGLNELRRALKKLDDENSTEWRKELAAANFKVADFVVQQARPEMASLGGMGARAAATMTASRSGVSARLSPGGAKAPFAEGVEFGAHRNKRRIIKNTGGRATIVRSGEDIDVVTGRVEAQSIETQARGTALKRLRGQGVTAVKAVRVIEGWNQFRSWKGNGPTAGYALYPTMRAHETETIEIYGQAVDQIMTDAFPD